MSIAKQTSPKGANAHGHYTLPITVYSIPLPAKLLADQLHSYFSRGGERIMDN